MKDFLYDLVWQTLRDNEESRGNDMILLLEVWKRQGLVLTNDQEKKLLTLWHPETIGRIRRKIQATGKYLARSYEKAQRSLYEMEYINKYRLEVK